MDRVNLDTPRDPGSRPETGSSATAALPAGGPGHPGRMNTAGGGQSRTPQTPERDKGK